MRKITAALCIIAILLLCASCAKPAETPPVPAEPPATAAPEPLAVYTPTPTPEQTPEPIPTPTPEPTPPPEQTDFVLTFAGDCTLAAEHDYRTADWGFGAVMGDNYAYPFEYASEYMLNDDFTIVNLECALTNYNVPADKMFRFRGDPEYTAVLTLGGVDCVTVANNHSGDYGQTGLDDTKKFLEAANIAVATDGGCCMYKTSGGLMIGVFGAFYRFDRMAYCIGLLRDSGADIVIAAFHFGEEGSYRYDYNQESYAKKAIDYGADIVFGCHPHVLQKIVKYGNGIIYYSLGNFVFGGNSNPRDKDTCIIRQHVIKENGRYRLGETEIIPFSLSGEDSYNDYRPVPLEEGSERYQRVLSKLDGSFTGPDLYVSYNHPSPEPGEDPTPEPVSDPAPVPDPVPDPAPEPDPAPAPEPVSDPEPVPEPISEPDPAPVPEPAPEGGGE